jgi:hypothetical protein
VDFFYTYVKDGFKNDDIGGTNMFKTPKKMLNFSRKSLCLTLETLDDKNGLLVFKMS